MMMYPIRSGAGPNLSALMVPRIRPVPMAPAMAIMLSCLGFMPRCRSSWTVSPTASSLWYPSPTASGDGAVADFFSSWRSGDGDGSVVFSPKRFLICERKPIVTTLALPTAVWGGQPWGNSGERKIRGGDRDRCEGGGGM